MEINGKIVYPEGWSPEYVNGVFGGINNHGEIIINFIRDVNFMPNSVKVVLEDGKAPNDVFADQQGFTRNVVNSIMVSHETAKAIAEWILRTAQQAEALITPARKV